MKKFFKKYIIYFLALGMATACKKTESHLPDREKSPEVAEIAKNYLDVLSGAQEGWILSYKPEQYSDTVHIHLKFHEQEVNMLSGIRGYHETYDTTFFDFEGKYSPVIVFSEESIFGKIKDEWNGFHKFKIDYDEDEGVFGLKRSDGYDDKRLKLTKASEDALKPLDAKIDTILALIAFEEEQERLLYEIIQKFNTFVGYESDFYFYNLRTDGFSGAITSVDTANRQITFKYKVTPTAAPTELTTNYSFITNGIVLSPAITYSGVEIDTIQLGELEYPHIEVLKAGNAGAGKMGFMHEAPYAFTLSTDRSLTLADYLLQVYPSYLQSSGRLSDSALAHSEDLRNYIETNTSYKTDSRWLFFIYAPQYPTASIASNFYVGASKADGSVGNFRYDVDIKPASGNRFIMNRLTRQIIPSPTTEPELNIMSTVQNFMDQVYPEAGILAVPYNMADEGGSGYRIRLINSEDSRIWVEYRWLNATYWNLIFD